PSEIWLASLSRVRRIGHHWKNVPSSPTGWSPASRACSATHPVARISSSVPASRPRIASPPIANMSCRRSLSLIASSAGANVGDPGRGGAAGDVEGAEPADEHPIATETSVAASAALRVGARANVGRDDRLDPAADVEVTHHLHPLWFRCLGEVVENS